MTDQPDQVIRLIEAPTGGHPYTTMLSGTDIGAPDTVSPDDIKLPDIVAGLAKACRFNGQIDGFYSVAEHSILVMRALQADGFDEDVQRAGLLHDAHEAYMGDFASPQKAMVSGMRAFEQGFEEVVRTSLSLPEPGSAIWATVRQRDVMLLHREVATLRQRPTKWYDHQIDDMLPPSIQPAGLSWDQAALAFRRELHRLGYGLGGTV